VGIKEERDAAEISQLQLGFSGRLWVVLIRVLMLINLIKG
jgi:hypothetical protein